MQLRTPSQKARRLRVPRFVAMKPSGMLAACVVAVLCALGPSISCAEKLAVAKPALSTAPLSVPHKTLHGPGPSSAHPRTLLTGALPMVCVCSLVVRWRLLLPPYLPLCEL